MEVLSPSATSTSKQFSFHPLKNPFQNPNVNLKFPPLRKRKQYSLSFTSHLPPITSLRNSVDAGLTSTSSPTPSSLWSSNRRWIVLVERPPEAVNSKREVVDYYVKTLERVLGSEKDAQMCIYNAFWETHFGFCCDIDEQTSVELARLPGILSVKPDPDFTSIKKGNTKHWLVRIDKPGIGVVTKAQMVDYYVQILSKVLGNEKDAEMCIYHISWQSNFGFCCELDEECARELAGVPGVSSIQRDTNFEAENKDYGENNAQKPLGLSDSSDADQRTPMKTKKLFVTGLSFYTSEKTLRAAFEGFGELVQVKIIMDKISKRSKGYAFIEYTTEEAAAAALKEMNGKIINGWMIVVDVAKPSPRRYSGNHTRPGV